MTGPKDDYSPAEAARICGVSVNTIHRCFDRGDLKGFRVPGSRYRRIPHEELWRFMRTHGIPLDRLEGRA